MVTDFIDEFNGYLAMSLTLRDIARQAEIGLDIPIYAREVMHIGAEQDGYFIANQFYLQVGKAARIAAFKYPEDISITSFSYLTKPKFMWLMTMMPLLHIR